MDTITLTPGFGLYQLDLSSSSTATALGFGPGVTASDLIFTQTDYRSAVQSGQIVEWGQWTITFRNSSDRIVVARPFGPLDHLGGLDHLQFADGSSLYPAAILAQLHMTENSRYFVQGTSASDVLAGDARPHEILGHEGDDTLVSGSGNDTLCGGAGNDTYRFGATWGRDVIVHDTLSQERVEFTEGVSVSDVLALRVGSDLVLVRRSSDDEIRITNFFNGYLNDAQTVQSFTFADGTVWRYADLYHRLAASATPYGDELHGLSSEPALIMAGAGADLVTGGSRSDTLLGGGGDDTLSGGGGADVLQGGGGRDVLKGGAGTVFEFGRGFSQDTVQASGPIILRFLDGISSSDVEVVYRTLESPLIPGVLVLIHKASGDSVAVMPQPGQPDPVLTVVFDDGVTWAPADVAANTITRVVATGITQTGTEGADVLTATGWGDTLTGGAGADTYVLSGVGTTVSLQGQLTGEIDTLVFGEGVNPNDLRFTMPSMAYVDPLTESHGDSHGGIVLPPAPPSVYQVAITTSQAQGGVVLSVPVGADPFGSVRLSFADGSAWSPEEFRTLVYAGSDRSDMFYGTTGLAETFTFGLGRGRDTIRRFDPLQDTLALETDDVSFSTVSYRAYAGTDHYGNGQYNTVSSILVTLNASGEVLELYDQHLMGSEPFVRLPNGVVLTGAEMQVYRGPLRVLPTMADDRVAGSADDDVLLGLSGADVLTGLAGADTLDGGLGDDTLQGGSGHDLLRGGSGSNVFAYDRGDGRDTLVADVATTQTLVFGEGITASDIEISRAFVSGAYSPAVLGTQVLFKSRPADSVTSWFELSSIRFADGSTWGAQEFKDAMYRGSSAHDRIFGDAAGNVLQGGDGDDTLSGEAGADVLSGGAGRDSLRGGLDADALDGGSGDDTLSGDEGFDTLEGGEGGDWLDGGAGADRLKGGRGNDVIYTFTDYQYNDGAADVITFEAGDGQDTVGAGAEDTLVFGAGLSRDDLLIGTLPVGPGKEFVLGFRGRTDAVTVRVDTGGRGIPSLRFADGRTLSSADLTAIVTRDQPKDLMGTSGRDTLTGGGGNDTLTGLAGQDTLSGGKGNDLLVGGKGSDTYLFARGDGRDTIVEADSTWLVTDVLKVGDAKSNQLWLTRSGNSLDISIIGTTDKVTVQDWFVSSANRVEKITALGDNKTLSYTKVNALVTAMAAFAPPAQGQTILPTDVQASLNKVLASSWA